MASLRISRTITRHAEHLLARPASATQRLVATSINRIPAVKPQRAVTPFHHRKFSTTPHQRESSDTPPSPSGISPPRSYTFTDIRSLSSSPQPDTILIDVREPTELLSTGRIPTAKSLPLSSGPDAFFLSPEDFEAKYGWARPTKDDEVVFYCKAGVRSRQAALLASQAGFGGEIGNYQGSWLDWEKNGGEVEREGSQE